MGSVVQLPLPLLLALLHLIESVAGQEKCDLYCNKGCDEYFRDGSSRFQECVSAHIDCNCVGGHFAKVGIFIVSVFGVIIVVSICACVILACISSKRHRWRGNIIQSHPSSGGTMQTQPQFRYPYPPQGTQLSYQYVDPDPPPAYNPGFSTQWSNPPGAGAPPFQPGPISMAMPPYK